MPQLKEVILNDGKTNQTYKPESLDSNGVSLLVNRGSTGQKALESRLTISTKDISGGSGGRRIKLKLTTPHTKTHADATREVIATSIADIELRYAAISRVDERKAIISQLKSLIGSTDAMIKAVVNDMEALY